MPSRLKTLLLGKSKKGRRLRIFIELLVISGLLPIVFLTLTSESRRARAWFNDSWTYRVPIIFNNSGSAVTYQKVKFDIDTATLISAGKMQSDCGDSRFTNINGNLLEYYLDSSGGACNTNSTDYYVLLPEIIAGNNIVYHYYGNAAIQNGTWSSQFPQTTFSPNGSPSAGTEEKGQSPVMYLSFDENYGSIAYDTSSNANIATFSGTFRQPEQSCRSGSCAQLSSGSFGVASSSASLNFAASDSFTLQAWIRTAGKWNYRKTVTLTYSGSALTDFQVVLTTDTATPIAAGHMKSDCSDIRFYDPSVGQGVNLSYWIQSGCNTASTRIWIKIPSISANKDIYMYYGNLNAASLSSGVSTFDEFDDFDGTDIDTNKWHFWNPYSWASYSVADSVLTISAANTGSVVKGAGVISNNTFSFSNHVVETKVKWAFTSPSTYTHSMSARTRLWGSYSPATAGGGNNYHVQYMFYRGLFSNLPQLGMEKIINDSYTALQTAIQVANDNNPADYRYHQFRYYSGPGQNFRTSTDEITYTNRLTGTDTMWSLPVSAYWGMNIEAKTASPHTTVGYWDWIRIRKYAATEPTTSIGSESQVSLQQTIFSKYDSSVSAGGYRLYMDTNGKLIFGIDDDNTSFPEDSVTSGTNYADGLWHLVTAVKDGTSGIRLYVDGIAAGSDLSLSATGSLSNSTHFFIGTSDTQSSNPWSGYLDEVKVYRYARSADQIKSDVNIDPGKRGSAVSFSPDTSYLSQGLVGYWKLDESSGTAADSSGFANTLANSGTTTYVSGKFGNGSEHIPASSQYLYISPINAQNVKTISFWVNPDSTTNYYLDLATGTSITSAGTISTTNLANVKVYVNGRPTTAISADTWQMVTITSDGDTADNITIGKAGSNYFDGTLDEIRFYNRILSPLEIEKLYNWAPGPIAHWKLDENLGSSAFDTSSNNYTGSFTGSPVWSVGKFGSSLSFNGSSQAVTATIADPGYSNTVELWVYPVTSVASKTLITSGKLTTDSSSRPVYGSCTGTALSLNQWTHIAAVSSDSTHCVIYQNGVQTSSSATTGVSFGTSVNIAASSFSGRIDDVRIYHYPRTSAQVVGDANAGHPAPGSPVGSAMVHWDFEEGYSSTAHNTGSGGTSLNGTIGSSSWTNSGKFGKGLTLTASSSVTATITDPGYNNSVSLWVYPTTSAASKILVTSGKLATDGSSLPTYGGCTGSTLPLNTWTHLLAVSDGSSSCAIYQNGKLTASGTSGVTFGTSINIGASSFTGSVDEFNFYTFALTADQAKALYNQGSAAVLGSLSTSSDGTTADWSSAREYCIPGDTSSCSSPVAHWKLDENTGTTAYNTSPSSGTYNVTLAGSNSWIPGKFGSAIKFAHNSDIGNVGDINEIDGVSAFTISGWLKENTFDDWATIFLKYQSETNYISITYTGTQGEIYADIANSTAANLTVSDAFSTGEWFYLTVVYDGSLANASRVKIYVNGVIQSGSVSGTFPTTTGSNSNDFHIGPINSTSFDNLKIYNYARTSAQVAWDYNRGAPVAQYDFDECSGTVLHDTAPKADSSTTGYNGTIYPGDTSGANDTVGNCSSGTSTEMWNDGTTGKFQSALGFDGTNDYVEIPDTTNSALDMTDQITVAAWVYPTSNFSGYTRIGDKDYRTSWFFGSRQSNNNNLSVWINDRERAYSADNILPLNTWSHTVFTYDKNVGSDQVKIYLNGQVVGMGTYSTALGTNNSSVFISSSAIYPGQYVFPGLIDDFRIYNYPLTQVQIKTLYNQNSSVRF